MGSFRTKKGSPVTRMILDMQAKRRLPRHKASEPTVTQTQTFDSWLAEAKQFIQFLLKLTTIGIVVRLVIVILH